LDYRKLDNDNVLLGIPEMKLFEDIFEWAVLIMAFILLVIPEILYSLILKAWDWIANRIMEL